MKPGFTRLGFIFFGDIMKNLIKIPVPFILEMDDVGWIDGRDYSNQGCASRSGLNRNHCCFQEAAENDIHSLREGAVLRS